MYKTRGGKKLRGNPLKRKFALSAQTCSSAPLVAAAAISNTSNKRAKTTKFGDADDGFVTTKLDSHLDRDTNEITISPDHIVWSRDWKDPRPLLHRMMNPALRVIASGAIEDLQSDSPYQTVTTKYFNTMTDITYCRLQLDGALTQGPTTVANPLGGVIYANAAVMEPSITGDVDNSPFVIHKRTERHNLRNRASANCHLILEEWICIRDSESKTPSLLDGDRRNTNEILDAVNRTGITNVGWKTDGAASSSALIPLNRPGERIHGPEVNLYWKKIRTSKATLSPGESIHYIMDQPKMTVSQMFMTHYNVTEGVIYLAGVTRALVIYQTGELIGSSAALKISHGATRLAYTHDNFVAVSGITAIKPKRIEIFNTARTGPWDTISTTDAVFYNPETGARDTGIEAD